MDCSFFLLFSRPERSKYAAAVGKSAGRQPKARRLWLLSTLGEGGPRPSSRAAPYILVSFRLGRHRTVIVANCLMWRDSATIVIRNVPADVCGTCREDHLDATVASSLEAALQEAASSGVRFEVREYKAA